MDDDETYKPFSNRLADKKEKRIYQATDNFKEMMVMTLNVCPIDDAPYYKHIK